MTKKATAVLKGFTALSDDERSDVLKEMTNYQNGTRYLRESVEKNLREQTINFGPAPANCPCCGR